MAPEAGSDDAILTFSGVSTAPSGEYDSPLWDVNFRLGAGDLMLIRLERERSRMPLADAAVGLAAPVRGCVQFLGEDWVGMTPDRSCERRGRVGRVFGGRGWVNNLSLDENLTLAQRFHTTREPADIELEALQLARFFGLPGLPKGEVYLTRRQDLNRAECVRAFLGDPRLVILETPTGDIYPEILSPLLNAIKVVREKGAAVLWLTADPREWSDANIKANMRGMFFGSRLKVSPEEVR